MRSIRSFSLLFLLAFTLPLSAQVALAPAAGFAADQPFAPDEIVSAFGVDLAASTVIATETPLPTELGGATVVVTDSAGVDHVAQLFFVSPGQVNFLMPAGVALGEATVAFRDGMGGEQTTTAEIRAVAPGIFELNPEGLAAASILRVAADGTQTLEPVFMTSPTGRVIPRPIPPAADGEQLFLIGFAGGLRGHDGLSTIDVEVGGLPADTLFAGDQGAFAGLDQFNAGPLSPLLSGRSRAEILLRVDGFAANMPFVQFGGPIAAQRPEIINVTPDVLRRDELLPEFDIRGRRMAQATAVEFMPPDGLAFAQDSQSDAAIMGRLTVAEDAPLTPRVVSVLSPNGRSKWIPLTVVDLPEDAPVISNLDLTMVAPPSGLTINLGVDWRDRNGDIRWTGSVNGSAVVELDLTSDGLTCRYLMTGFFADVAGLTSNRFIVGGGTGRTDLAERGMSTFEVVLIDGSGNRSNTLTGEVMVKPICDPDGEREVFIF